MEALSLYNCFRLAARIADIRAMGIDVTANIIKEGGKRFAEYIIEPSDVLTEKDVIMQRLSCPNGACEG